MTQHYLATYLNDHLAGSVMAIRLMESLESTYAERTGTQEIAGIVRQTREDIEADQRVLEGIIARIGIDESPLRKAAGWIAERVAGAKLIVEDGSDGPFRMLESTEVITLGILGKRGLWKALQSLEGRIPAVHGIDFDALVARADAQHERMEQLRLGAARAALDNARE